MCMGIFFTKNATDLPKHLPFLVPLLAKNAPNIVELAIVCFAQF